MAERAGPGAGAAAAGGGAGAGGHGLTVDERPDVAVCARVLAAAFAREPATRWICGARPAVREHWFAATLEAQAGLPGARREVLRTADGEPVAAAVLTPPGATPGTAARARWLARTLRHCGAKPLVRTLGYLHRTEPLAPDGAWTLEFVGVDPRHAGRGAGRTLLERLPDAVFLTTAGPGNVALYHRFGFGELHRLRVGPLEVTAMARAAT